MLAVQILVVSIIVTPVIESLHPNGRFYLNKGYTQRQSCASKNQTKTPIKIISPINLESPTIYYEPLESNLLSLKNIHLLNPILKGKSLPRRAHRSNNYTLNEKENLVIKRQLHVKTLIHNNTVPIYLDIDVSEKINATFGTELRNVSNNLQPIERDLLDCISLHMVSNNIDNINKTNTNWGYNVKRFDNISDLKLLSEEKNKCKKLSDLMALGLEHILMKYRKEDRKITSSPPINKVKDINLLDLVTDSYTDDTTNPDYINESDTFLESPDVTQDEKITYQSNFNTITTVPTEFYSTSVFEADVDFKENATTLTKNYKEITTSSDQQDYTTNTSQQNFNFNKHTTTTETKIHDRLEHFTDTTITNINNADDLNRYYDITTTPDITFTETNTAIDMKISGSLYSEKDLETKILTTDFVNSTAISDVDGYESMSNSDYDTYSTTTAYKVEPINLINSGETKAVTKVDMKSDVEQNLRREISNETNNWPTQIPEIKGRLYFMYGKHEIPVNFVQKRDGEINMAIDAHLICDKYLEQGEKESIFMRLLCNCAINHKCTNEV